MYSDGKHRVSRRALYNKTLKYFGVHCVVVMGCILKMSFTLHDETKQNSVHTVIILYLFVFNKILCKTHTKDYQRSLKLTTLKYQLEMEDHIRNIALKIIRQ